MSSHLHLMPESALKLVHQRQAELASQFGKQSREQASRTQFLRMFHLRRLLFRLVPRVAANI